MSNTPKDSDVLLRHIQDIKAGHEHLIVEQLYEDILGLVGEDEPFTDTDITAPFTDYGIRRKNELKAQQRTKLAEYFGVTV